MSGVCIEAEFNLATPLNVAYMSTVSSVSIVGEGGRERRAVTFSAKSLLFSLLVHRDAHAHHGHRHQVPLRVIRTHRLILSTKVWRPRPFNASLGYTSSASGHSRRGGRPHRIAHGFARADVSIGLTLLCSDMDSLQNPRRGAHR